MFETVSSHARQNISLEYYVTRTWFKHIPEIAGIYCKDCCACDNCLNKPDFEDIVLNIRPQIELRNPLAFARPIVNPPNDSPNVTGDGNLMNTPSARHKSGCKCKRSKCLK